MLDLRLRIVCAWGSMLLLSQVLPRMLDAAPLAPSVEYGHRFDVKSTGYPCYRIVVEPGQVLDLKISSDRPRGYVISIACINSDSTWLAQEEGRAPGTSAESLSQRTTNDTRPKRAHGGILDKYGEIPHTLPFIQALIDRWSEFRSKRDTGEAQANQGAPQLQIPASQSDQGVVSSEQQLVHIEEPAAAFQEYDEEKPTLNIIFSRTETGTVWVELVLHWGGARNHLCQILGAEVLEVR